MGGKSDDEFVGMAMSEAARVFNQLEAQGDDLRGTKEEAVFFAVQTAMKLMNAAGDKAGRGGGGLLGLLSSPQPGRNRGGGGGILGLLGNIL